jgi:formamidopyrimidine-DNA glycosylase
MPELPDIEAYLEALRPRVVGQPLLNIRVINPFVLRTYDPPLEVLLNGIVRGASRLGKRLVFEITAPASDTCYFLVVHLMIAGRLRWRAAAAPTPGSTADQAGSAMEVPSAAGGRASAGGRAALPQRGTLASLEFPTGTLFLAEAGSKRRASLHLLEGRAALSALDPGGIEVGVTAEQFAEALCRENRTLKRALTDPRTFSGIGNAFSDEILHRARLSPFKLTRSLSDDELTRLHEAARAVMTEWTARLVSAARDRFPDKVTAFRPEMAVHGKFGSPCPVCGTPVHRIVYADSECDYCPGCQTGGRVLADRSLSRLLKGDWPRGLAEGDES